MLHTPVNSEELYEIMGSDEQLIRECFNDFIVDYPDMIEALKVAVEAQDFNALNDAAHKLKGRVKLSGCKAGFQGSTRAGAGRKRQTSRGTCPKTCRTGGIVPASSGVHS